uniref:Uncharacterized protein n=1 Tax=Plectus sambesii TaxID=2011161 RepID=A0A914X719_9BILA
MSVVWSIRDRLMQCTVDLFATRLNCQMPHFFSWRPDPEALAVDAFAQNWAKICAYAFPPFCLVGRTLQKVLMDRAEILLIAPVWQTQSWRPLLLQLAVEGPFLLPQKEQLLSAQSGEPHPLIANHTLLLSAWQISDLLLTS